MAIIIPMMIPAGGLRDGVLNDCGDEVNLAGVPVPLLVIVEGFVVRLATSATPNAKPS